MKILTVLIALFCLPAFALAGDNSVAIHIANFTHEQLTYGLSGLAMVGYIKVFPIPTYNGVLGNASTTALTWQVPQGFVFKSLRLTFGGTMTAGKIAKLRVRLGAKNIVPDLKGSDFATMLAWKGYTADTSYLPIPFNDYTAATEEEARLGEVSTVSFNGQQNKYSEFTVQVTPDGTQDGTATIFLEAEIDERAKPSEITHGYDSENLIRAWTYSDAPLTAANSNNVLPFNNGTDYRNSIVHLFLFNTHVTNFSLTRDQEKILDNITTGSVGFGQKESGRVPQNNLLALDFCPKGYVLGNTLSLQRINPDGTSGGQYAMLWQAYATATETARQIVEVLAPYAQV